MLAPGILAHLWQEYHNSAKQGGIAAPELRLVAVYRIERRVDPGFTINTSGPKIEII